MTYATPSLRPIAAETSSASCCTFFLPPITILEKIHIRGTCIIG